MALDLKPNFNSQKTKSRIAEIFALLSIGCLGFLPLVSAFGNTLAYYEKAGTEMKRRGISSAFIDRLQKRIKDPKIRDQREKIVRPILMGFTIRPDYSGHISVQAEKACKTLKQKHKPAFKRAYQKYGVDPETIAALLWVETRHGKSTGFYEVAPSFFHIASATDPKLINKILDDYKSKEFKGNQEEWTAIIQKVNDRAAARSQWAIDQLESLYKIETKKHIAVMKLKGSYAGAFGIPQFLPSSYLDFAESFNKEENVPNLFSMNDAILSVAKYLHKHGWDKRNPDKQREALFGYNRSKDYGETILNLAANVRGHSSTEPHRSVASGAESSLK